MAGTLSRWLAIVQQLRMFDAACLLLEATLKGETRREILADISKSKNFDQALQRLRDGMRANLFRIGVQRVQFEKVIRSLDNRTRQDGFHVLHDWDGKADKLNKDTIPVDVANYIIGTSSRAAFNRNVLAVLLDYYFVYVVALLCLRVWDKGNPNDNLNRLAQLLRDLQGSNGSGQKFADNAETLMFIATSHFEPDDKAYERLLAKVRTLDQSHQMNIALVDAAILGSHLRYGFEYFYKRDIVTMRNDNVPDYPWLCFSLLTLMKAYSRMCGEGVQGMEREKIVEALLNGLSPDARAFAGKPPASLAAHEAEHTQFSELFQKNKQELFEEFEHHRPSNELYSPMSFGFNFPHNLLKGIVVDALLRGEPSNLTVNDLLTGIPRDEEVSEARETLARTLMDFARSSPDQLRDRAVLSIVYDPYSGLRDFAKAISLLKEHRQ